MKIKRLWSRSSIFKNLKQKCLQSRGSKLAVCQLATLGAEMYFLWMRYDVLHFLENFLLKTKRFLFCLWKLEDLARPELNSIMATISCSGIPFEQGHSLQFSASIAPCCLHPACLTHLYYLPDWESLLQRITHFFTTWKTCCF